MASPPCAGTAGGDGPTEKDLITELDDFTNSSALMIAHERALETEGHHGPPLFTDPYARRLAGSKGAELSEQFGADAAGPFGFGEWTDFHRCWTSVRTRYIDDTLTGIVSNADKRAVQFVNLGAGLDTRALRMEVLAGCAGCFEVDVEAVNTAKARVLGLLGATPHCTQRLVTADLTVGGALTAGLEGTGYKREAPSVFLAEGLIMYLGSCQRQFLAEVSSLAAPGSHLILNFMDSPPSESNLSEDQLMGCLKEGGWAVGAVQRFGDAVLNYGRYNSAFAPSKSFSFLVAVKA